MRGHKNTPCEPAARATALSGVIVAVAAVLGAHALSQAGSLRATKHTVAPSWTSVSQANPIYDSQGLFLVAGAAVMLIVWLQRQSMKSLVAIRPVTVHSIRRPQTQCLPQARRFAISRHQGGLYGS